MCSTDWANGSYYGAGNEGRTRDIQLGRLTLYHLSYSRIFLVAEIGFEPMTFGLWAQRATWLLYSAIRHWCLGPDSNRHGINFHRILSPVRLPISPPRHLLNQNKFYYTRIVLFCQQFFLFFLNLIYKANIFRYLLLF